MIALTGGILLDLLLGDPEGWPHPVRWVGRVIDRGQGLILGRGLKPRAERAAGLLLWVAVVGGTWAAGVLLLVLLKAIWPPLALLAGALMVWTCLSLKDLLKHVRPVLSALVSGDVEAARKSLSLVVGRETSELDEDGICRAGLETLAENLSDGLVAPLFYLLIGGPALGLAYKAVNTLDSMLGYPYPPYVEIGFWPAKLDDVFNWIPARLTFFLIVCGSALLRLRAALAFKVGLAEHGRSESPNAGWPEAAMAGALDVSLLGPATYQGHYVQKPYLNESGHQPKTDDLKAGLKLTWVTGLLAMGLAVALTAVFL